LRRIEVILNVALRELTDRLRNRWVWTVSFLFLASALVIAFFGTAPAGVTGLRGGGAALASLMNLSVYLVPLLALVLGSSAIIEEKRRNTLDLALTYPMHSSEYFYGTFLGYLMALSISLVGSFVPIAIVLRGIAGIDLAEISLLLYLVLLLGAAFLAISFLVSILSREHGRSVASAVLVWIVAVFLFDLLLVGTLVLMPERVSSGVFGSIMLLNPTDIFRLVCFQWVGSAAQPLGLATVAPSIPTSALVAALFAWTLVPLLISQLLFQRRVALDKLV
jgi:Cu-processing system permease protein